MAGERGRHFMATSMGYGIVDEARRVEYGDNPPAPVLSVIRAASENPGDGSGDVSGEGSGDTESEGVDENKNLGENEGESEEN